MKKILLAVLATAMVIGLGSCGAGGKTYYVEATELCTEVTNNDADGQLYLERSYTLGNCPAEYSGKSCSWTDSSNSAIYGDFNFEIITKGTDTAALKIACGSHTIN